MVMKPGAFSLKLKKSAPVIRRILFNGREAGKFAPHLLAMGFEVLTLPSTSPANATWNFERKLTVWREALDPIIQKNVDR